ncbi:TNF receptor-associated factor like [Actinidia chinensis var. chinensis]|uniref:TNF receptor-associated factor like n=1 Tax=Actinidia chinensis var. chinensis TaxID=1590841 RepID=A0A2R6QGU9_ACTCC|nr:TNF receptor-associated factor like [Actinidia chinensis var. chinensis]
MDLPPIDIEAKPEKLEEAKEAGPSFHCDLSDTEIVHKIAQAFLPGLASACVDNTTGGLFNSPASVAVDMRREMVEYLTLRSETFVAESVILEGGPEAEVSDHPDDIISDFVDDFGSSKRNIFSRVSGWLLSERREDRIDDFVQEMEINGFWLIERREVIAQTLLKNVDFKNTFHCDMKFNSAAELAEHSLECNFRTMNCTNEGCNARFCASHLENHTSICPFEILPCEQMCSDSIMRREMDKHCIIVCPMRLVNCPFYPVGCQSSVPHCTIQQHRLDDLHSHLLYILQVIHKDASMEVLKKRSEQLEESASPGRLAEARDVRSLTFAIKDLEVEIGPLSVNANFGEEHTESPNKKEHTESPTKIEERVKSPSKKVEFNDSPNKEDDNADSYSSEEECKDSPPKKEEFPELPSEKEQHKESPTRKEENNESPSKKEEFNDSPNKEDDNADSSSSEEECKDSPPKKEECPELPSEKDQCKESPRSEDSPKSATGEEESKE